MVNKKQETVNKNKHTQHREDVVYFKRTSQPQIAAAIGYTKQAVSMAMSGKTKALKLHTAIANYLNVPLVEFWPELYDNLAMLNNVSHGATVSESESTVN